nr:vacuolar amino acid transporter 1-like [Ipomoea trifida]
MEHSSHSSAERGESQRHQSDDDQGTPFWKSCFNGLNTFSGVGILSVPYALSEGGWLCLMIMVLVAISCCYTGLLLQKCMDSSQRINTTYPDIGERAFGNKGRWLISTFMYLELYFVSVEFLILEGDNLQKLFPNANVHLGQLKLGPKQAFVLLVALVILPTTWLRNLGLLAYVSAGGVLASLLLVCCTFWIGAKDGVGFHERGEVWGSLSGVIRALSLFSFCYSGHPVIPSLRNSMRDRTQFSKVLILCFAVSTLNYGSMAMLGNLMYGRHLQSQVTLNLPTNKIASKIAIYITLANPITKYAIIVAPIAAAIEDVIQALSPRCNGVVIMLTMRTCLVISTVIVALTVPLFGPIMGFVGAFLNVALSFLFPCACYLKINAGSRRFGIELCVVVMIMVLGSLIGVVGTYISIRDIIEETVVVQVDSGDTNLLRVINAALNQQLFFSVANHKLTVVGANASYVKPFTTSVIMLGPGQITDVLITTAFTKSFRSLRNVEVPTEIDENLFITVGLGLNNCPKGASSQNCQGPNGTRFAASMNNVSFVLPSNFSLLQAHHQGIPGVFTTDFPAAPPVKFDYTGNVSRSLWQPASGTKVYRLKYGARVQIVLQGTSIFTAENHPIHLHGYDFYILAEGFGNFNPQKDTAKFNLVNPPLRNTASVPVNGWKVIRFVADNPGEVDEFHEQNE